MRASLGIADGPSLAEGPVRAGFPTLAACLTLAGCLALAGCQLASLLLPTQRLQLINRSTTTVVVRVAPFRPGQSYITDAQAAQKATLTPRQDTTFSLPSGHYGVYAEVSTDANTAASTDITLTKDSGLTLVEHFIDHASSATTTGSQERALGWDNQ